MSVYCLFIIFYMTIVSEYHVGRVIDRDTCLGLYTDIAVVAVVFFFPPLHLDLATLQQNLAIASFSNSLCYFSNSRRSADLTNWWPLQMTLTSDLDLMILLGFEPQLCTCWAKHLQSLTDASLDYGHSFDAKMSSVVCTNSIYRYIMFSVISWKVGFGHTFWT